MTRSSPLILVVVLATTALGQDVGFLEDFALAKDRAKALEQLIPGTDDYYYYHCLHAQNRERYDEVQGLVEKWIAKRGHTARVDQVLRRQALLTVSRSPEASYSFLKDRLGLGFSHSQDRPDARPKFPTRLDEKLFSREALTRRALRRRKDTRGFEDSALEGLLDADLTEAQRRHLMGRLNAPDTPRLVGHLLAELDSRLSRGFGSLPIHQRLLRSQLDELAQRKPKLLQDRRFVTNYLGKLKPSEDVDLSVDPGEMRAYLERLAAFTKRLSPAFNSLKAHVLYHRLRFDMSLGQLDQDRLLAYLAIPRRMPYARREYYNSRERRRSQAQLTANFGAASLFKPIGNDTALVRELLLRAFVEADSAARYSEYIEARTLRSLFAEAKLTNGLGDAERWHALLDPAGIKALKDRVDLDFAPESKRFFTADEPVALELAVKNVETLLVKVFEINAENYYRQRKSEVTTAIELDGLVPNHERSFKYEAPAIRRVRRRFDFPELIRPGLYVIDFIGAGQSSRALVRKGALRMSSRPGAAGQELRVYDEQNRPQTKASAWFGGQEYRADEAGIIVVPYSTRPGRRKVILKSGRRVTLAELDHAAESYALKVGFFSDRESLLRGARSEVMVRAALWLNGARADLALLEGPRLLMHATDLDGVVSTQEFKSFRLYDDRESVQVFKVPERLRSLRFELSAEVKSISGAKKQRLSASKAVQINGVDEGAQLVEAHLVRSAAGRHLELRGRTGERRPSVPVELRLKHRDFREPIRVMLQSDAKGRVWLGDLSSIVALMVRARGAAPRSYELARDRRVARSTRHLRAGVASSVPWMAAKPTELRAAVSLFALRSGQPAVDHSDKLSFDHERSLLVVAPLEAGDYELNVKPDGRRVTLRVAAGTIVAGRVLGGARELEFDAAPELQIAALEAGEDRVRIKLEGVGPQARVHVFATRFEPTMLAGQRLAEIGARGLGWERYARRDSGYAEGRTIGEEYRYILERRGARRFAGNMLARPGFLLNPFALRATDSGVQRAQGGGSFGALGGGRGRRGGSEGSGSSYGQGGQMGDNLDFLASPSVRLLNLSPDASGVIEVARAALGDRQHLSVVAVDAEHTVTRTLTLEEQPAALRDLRLERALDPKERFTQRRQATVLVQGGRFVMGDVRTGRFEVYDSLAKVYQLFGALSSDAKLKRFGFVLGWPGLSFEEKCEKYSRFACHELNIFVREKDPSFFDKVIKPYLANKKDKTFLDRYLCEEDLRDQLEPWAYGRLNVVERILLARRLGGAEAGATERHLRELLELDRPAAAWLTRLFEAALKGNALDVKDVLGVMTALEKARDRRSFDDAKTTLGYARPGASLQEEAGEADSESLDAPAVEEPAFPAKTSAPAANRARNRKSKKMSQGKAKDKAELKRFSADLAKRSEARRLYRKLDKTKEWAENNYFELPIEAQVASLVTVNDFWRDFAAQAGERSFVSRHFPQASRSFTEMMLALALLDLPFESPEHEVKLEAARLSLEAGGSLVVFHEQILGAEASARSGSILVSQNVFPYGERTRLVDGEQVENFLDEELLVHRVYGSQVVVTNSTARRQKLDVLLQIPKGAIPVLKGRATTKLKLDLAPYRTESFVAHFYFPRAGRFSQAPAQVARAEQLVASAEPVTFEVLERPSQLDTGSWEAVSQRGSEAEVFAYLEANNLQQTPLARLAWRMKDRAFFDRAIAALRARHAYDPVLWSYGVFHRDAAVTRQYLSYQDDFVRRLGGPIESPLLTVDPVRRHSYQQLEYAPLVNPRAHRLGQRRKILNARFAAQYRRLLEQLKFRGELDSEELLEVTYALLLQDRMDAALGFFERVDPAALACRLQYDYFSAYLAVTLEDVAKARAVASPYLEHPVARWRARFRAVVAQLDELTGAEAQVVDQGDRGEAQARLASSEPGLELEVSGRNISIDYQNLASVELRYYEMDVELLFSRKPFAQAVAGQFSLIEPNARERRELESGRGRLSLDIPERLANSNLLVEVVGGGVTKAQPYYANSLLAQVTERYGQLRVLEVGSRKPLSRVYCKVYAEFNDGSTRFYKDGYTDLRGRFDYTSLNTDELDGVKRFALLVLSDERGAVIKQAAPPQR